MHELDGDGEGGTRGNVSGEMSERSCCRWKKIRCSPSVEGGEEESYMFCKLSLAAEAIGEQVQ